MTDLNDLFNQTIKKAKKTEQTKKKNQEKEVNIAFNPKNEYPLYTVRIPRNLAKAVEIGKNDKLRFFIEKLPDNTPTLKAELRRNSKICQTRLNKQ